MLIEIRLAGDGIIEPQELPRLIEKVGEVVPGGGKEPVIISGRLPVWAYAALVHWFHPCPWVATYEPRLGKGVVVAWHVIGVKAGDLVEADKDDPQNVTVVYPEG